MTKEQLFKAELADLLKEYGVTMCIEEERGHYHTEIRGLEFVTPYSGDPQVDINFILLGYYFDHEDIK
jgi:hypothetical protein